MAREKVDNKLNVVIGTKAQIDGDAGIPENSIIIATDEELAWEDVVDKPDMMLRSVVTSFDQTTPGFYSITSSGSDRPLSTETLWGLIVYQAGSSAIQQIATSNTNNRVFLRSKTGSNNWTSWEEMLRSSDKTNTLSSSSTNDEIPSAEAVYNYSQPKITGGSGILGKGVTDGTLKIYNLLQDISTGEITHDDLATAKSMIDMLTNYQKKSAVGNKILTQSGTAGTFGELNKISAIYGNSTNSDIPTARAVINYVDEAVINYVDESKQVVKLWDGELRLTAYQSIDNLSPEQYTMIGIDWEYRKSTEETTSWVNWIDSTAHGKYVRIYQMEDYSEQWTEDPYSMDNKATISLIGFSTSVHTNYLAFGSPRKITLQNSAIGNATCYFNMTILDNVYIKAIYGIKA